MEKASGVGVEYLRECLSWNWPDFFLLFSVSTTGLVTEAGFVEQSPNIKLG